MTAQGNRPRNYILKTQIVCPFSGSLSEIQDALRQSMQVTAQLAPPERALGFHKEVYSAIHLRQPEQARQRMIDHFEDAQGVLLLACLEETISSYSYGGIGTQSRMQAKDVQ